MRFEGHLKTDKKSPAKTQTNWLFLVVLLVVTGLFLVWIQQIIQPTTIESVLIDVQEEGGEEITESNDEDEVEDEAVRDLPLREFTDREVGISFLYPIDTGGVVSYFDEFGCSESQTQCYTRYYTVQDPGSGRQATFAAVMTEAYKQEPLARGFQWTDQLLLLSDNWRQVCERDASCQVRENEIGLSYYQFDQFPQPEFAQGDAGNGTIPSFVFEVPVRTYAQVIVSQNDLDWLSEQQKEDFITTVIATFDFFE